MKLRTTLAGAALFAAALPSFAQVKLNDAITVTGWATGSYQYTKPDPGTSVDSLNMDAALVEGIFTPAKKTTATVSLFYRPSNEGGVSPSGSEATILDAYVSYDAGGGVTLTAGKFLSYLGYESFYAINDNMISLANQQLLAPIPGYHNGFKVDYSPDKTDTMGFSIADAEFQKPGYAATESDGELKHNGGFEAYYSNTAITGLTVWAGFGYQTSTPPGVDTSGVAAPKGSEISVGDIWISYVVDKAGDTLALEEIYKDGGTLNKGSNWLAYFQYNVPNTKVYSWFCLSGEDVDGGASYVKYSVAPTYVYNGNLSARLQYSYTDYSKFSVKNANYFGAEILFKF
ncbi:MAG TPA: outer membrane beta-barrel protein [Opitutaceae bacterium]|nr:outer membrane beta-barrel protein [Opitutaceae bacterium]